MYQLKIKANINIMLSVCFDKLVSVQKQWKYELKHQNTQGHYW